MRDAGSNEDLSRSILETAPAMIFCAGPDGSCEYVNPAWLAFTGRTLDEELGDGWRAIVHPDDREPYLALYLATSARGEPFEARLRLRRHDGAYRAVLLRGASHDGPDGPAGYVWSGLDVEDISGDDAFGHAEFFEMSLDHLCVAGFDGYWKRLNPSWTRTLGWTPQEMMARPLIEFVHPDDREATLAGRRGVKEGVPLSNWRNRYRCEDGTYRWFEWKSVAAVERSLVYAIARDVTAEMEAERALRELTDSLRATLDSIGDGVISIDPAGAIVRLNPVAEELTGWSAAEAVGRPLDEVFELGRARADGAAHAPVEQTLQQSILAEGAEHSRLVARDRAERPIAYSRAPIRGPNGDVSGAVIVFRDMTAEQQARERQRTLQQQLMIADRMASVGTLAAGAAHEINNPLAYVMVNLDLIAEELRAMDDDASSPRLSECVGMIEEARQGAERIRTIVGGLKTFSRTDEERRAVVALEPILKRALGIVHNELRHRARLVTDLRRTPPVEADDSRLGQVFINLLVNAIQAIPEGDAHAHEIRVVTSTDAEGWAVIEIHDTGPGIAPEVIDRIFDPFFTTKPVGVGTGLGLSVCHNVVVGWGGQISARNRRGGGATLRVTLPPGRGAVRGEAIGASPSEVAPTRRAAAVLVVDDEAAIGISLRRVLRDHDVTLMTEARKALELVLSGVHFDVILSDLMMPGMSGMELYDELQRRRPRVAERVVFITGGAFTAAAQGFLDRVPNPRFDKPFDPAAIRALVERSVD